MLAKRVDELPAEGKWIFEPKWDGFRALVFRDGDELEIQSRDGKPLNRYFPEIVEALESQLPPRAVLDGEIVIARGSVLDFEALIFSLVNPASGSAFQVQLDEARAEWRRRIRIGIRAGQKGYPVHSVASCYNL